MLFGDEVFLANITLSPTENLKQMRLVRSEGLARSRSGPVATIPCWKDNTTEKTISIDGKVFESSNEFSSQEVGCYYQNQNLLYDITLERLR